MSERAGDEEEPTGELDPVVQAREIGYTEEQIANVPQTAVMGFGCANPLEFAALREGEIVLDIGCGGGLDALLAARQVGCEGRVIGVDSDPEMLHLARRNVAESGASNVELHLAEMDDLPEANNAIDVVISNCVINHAAEPEAVFREVCRVLCKGGRMIVADLVLEEPFDAERLCEAPESWREWLTRAVTGELYLGSIGRAGLQEIEVVQARAFNLAEAVEVLRGRLKSVVISARR